MSTVIKFFKLLYDGVMNALAFLVSLPGMIATSFATLGTSVYSIYNSLSNSGSFVSGWSSDLSTAVADFTYFVDIPPIVRMAGYAMSIDILFDGFVALLGFVFPVVTLVVTFLLITIPALALQIFVVKFSAWCCISLFPDAYIPSALRRLSTVNFDFVKASAIQNSSSVNMGLPL